jgi:uncharacterized protein (DUF4415 family)
MSDEQVLYQSPMMHRVVRLPDGALEIEVVVGRMAMEAVRVRLDDDELAQWQAEGGRFADRLAAAITANPRFGGRARST